LKIVSALLERWCSRLVDRRKTRNEQFRQHLFAGTRLPQAGRHNRADRLGQPEPPGSTRCSMPSTSL